MNLSIRNYVSGAEAAMDSSNRKAWHVLLFRTDSHLSAVILTSPIDLVCTVDKIIYKIRPAEHEEPLTSFSALAVRISTMVGSEKV